MRYTIAMIAGGFVLLAYGCAKADWQVHQYDGHDWHPAVTPKGRYATVNIEKTACELDLASLAMLKPSGTRLQCRQTPRPAVPPSR